MVTFSSTVAGIFSRLTEGAISLGIVLNFAFWLTARDLYYSIANPFLPKRGAGRVVPAGCPGYRGEWPKYIAPTKGQDSRSPCPALNALANHNILPHDGKRLTFKQISRAVQEAYNLAPSLGDQLIAAALPLDQGRGWIDLEDLAAQKVIQHDASFTRPDIAHCPDQSYPHPKLVNRFLAQASNGKTLTLNDISYYSGLRRAECSSNNGQYSLKGDLLHQIFGSGNGALMYSVFGGNVTDLRLWLVEERLPFGWEPKNREALGHTILQAQITTMAIEFNINEKQKLRTAQSAVNVNADGEQDATGC